LAPAASDQIGGSDFLRRLQSQTEAAHLKLEAGIGFSAHTMTEPGVRRFLERMHGFFRVWEPWVAASAVEPALTAPRHKLALIEADLHALGVTQPWDLPAYPVAFLEATPENVMGSLYVIEGSTLGGLVIRKWLRSAAWAPPGGFAYFNSYGRDSAKMWQGFRDSLVRFAAAADADAIISSANDTYDRIYHWHCDPDV
jgi:heme oxygenase (biliverdin-IX-beta and delta-forming)